MTKPEMADHDKPQNHTGYAHIAFSLGSKEKVDQLTEKLKMADLLYQADRVQPETVTMNHVLLPLKKTK